MVFKETIGGIEMRQQRKGRKRRLHNNEYIGKLIKISDIVANERTEILSYKTYDGATHQVGDKDLDLGIDNLQK